MFQEITYYLIFGIPFIIYLGAITLTFFSITIILAFLIRRRIIKTKIRWHFRFAYLSIILGIIHGSLGMLSII